MTYYKNYSHCFLYKNIYQRIYRDYMPVVIGDNSISVDGKVVETVKYSGGYPDPLAPGEPIAISPSTDIRQYPETPSTTADSWTDNGYSVVCKSSDGILGGQNTCYLFNNLIVHPDHYHSNALYNTSSPFNYTGSTSFKGANGIVTYIDLGREEGQYMFVI
jgi:hypothetical protein